MEWNPVKLVLTNESLDFIRENHISTHCRKNNFTAKVGDIIEFDIKTHIEPFTGFYPFSKILSFGAFSYSHSCNLHHLHFKVGRYCSIASDVSHMGFSHPITYISTSPFTYDRDESFVNDFLEQNFSGYDNFHHAAQKQVAVIKNDVWIGKGCILSNGITIDNGAVIAAHSVVTKNVPAYEIWGGNPAKFIKKRFEPDVEQIFSQLKWWNYKFTDFYRMPVQDPKLFARALNAEVNNLEPYQPKLISIIDMPANRIE